MKKDAGHVAFGGRFFFFFFLFPRPAGESAWNVVFNRGFGATFPIRLLRAMVREATLLPTLDSVFFDSPLSDLGATQALELQRFIETHPVLRGAPEGGKSVLVASNLRRALSTSTIGFWGRLKRTPQEKIHILSSLQEITFNVDGVALAKPRKAPVLADEELNALEVPRSKFRYECYDVSENHGNKPVRSKGLDRMLEFCRWCFARDEPTVIVTGHSLYFRFFFQTFLPLASTHVGKTSKMGNGAVVSFRLWEGESGDYVIEEETVEILHNDFELAKKH